MKPKFTNSKTNTKHATWILRLRTKNDIPYHEYKCSRCGRTAKAKEPYCHCGSKMDKVA